MSFILWFPVLHMSLIQSHSPTHSVTSPVSAIGVILCNAVLHQIRDLLQSKADAYSTWPHNYTCHAHWPRNVFI